MCIRDRGYAHSVQSVVQRGAGSWGFQHALAVNQLVAGWVSTGSTDPSEGVISTTESTHGQANSPLEVEAIWAGQTYYAAITYQLVRCQAACAPIQRISTQARRTRCESVSPLACLEVAEGVRVGRVEGTGVFVGLEGDSDGAKSRGRCDEE